MFPKVIIMTNLTTIRNNKIEATADMFIIPNSPRKFLEGFQYEDVAPDFINPRDERILQFSELNGIHIEKGEKLIQIWLTSKDELGSENLDDHGFRALNENGEIVHLHFNMSSIPVTMLIDKAEGDIIDMKIRCWDMDKNEYELLLHTRCCQSEYRYRRFGHFETLIKELIAC